MNPYSANRAKFEATMTQNNVLTSKRGIVTNFDPVGWTIDVQFYPLSSDDGNDSGVVQVQLSSLWVGNGWGLYCAPAIDTEALVIYETSNMQLPIAVNFVFNGDTSPLQGVQSGEMWLAHQSGSKLKLTNDGKISINGEVEIDMTAPTVVITTTGDATINADTANINATTQINLQAPLTHVIGALTVDGNLSANGGDTTMIGGVLTTTSIAATGDVTAAGISLNSHVHPDVQSGSSDTGAPI